MIRRTGWLLGLFLMLIVLCLLVLAFLPSAWLARHASSVASDYLGASVELQGLQLTPFSLTPTATIDSMLITRRPAAFNVHAGEVIVSVNLLSMFSGRLLLHRLRINDGGVDARIDEEGLGNWQSASNPDPARVMDFLASLFKVKIEDLVLDAFAVHLVNDQLDTELFLDVDVAASTSNAAKLTRLQMDGHANDQVVHAAAELGFLGQLLSLEGSGNEPLRMDIQASVGDDRLVLTGTVGNPAALHRVEMNLLLQVSAVDHWQAFSPRPLPDLPAFSLSGHMTRDDEDWLFRQIDGHFGNTDFSGDARADTSSRPVKVDIRLMSTQLAIDELLQWNTFADRSRKFIGSVDYQAEHVVSDIWPLQKVDFSAVLDDQQLAVYFNRVGLLGGELDGEIIHQLDDKPPVTRLRLNLKRLDLAQLRSASEDVETQLGQMAAHVRLDVSGETLATALSSANGEVVSLMTGHWLDRILQEVFGAELTQSLLANRSTTERSGQDCAFLDLRFGEGMIQLESLVFDTENIVYLGDGEIDGNSLLVDLTIEPHFKLAQETADAVHVVGKLSAAAVEAVHPALSRDSAVSVLAATMTPAVALLPFLNGVSSETDVLCQGLANALHGAK